MYFIAAGRVEGTSGGSLRVLVPASGGALKTCWMPSTSATEKEGEVENRNVMRRPEGKTVAKSGRYAMILRDIVCILW